MSDVCECVDCGTGEGARFAVVVTCIESPCSKCAYYQREESFLAPISHGRFVVRADAEADATMRAQRESTNDGQRFDVVVLRADGWPLCPWCGEDELYSLAGTDEGRAPTLQDPLAGCYHCGTTFAEVKRKTDVSRAWLGEDAEPPGKRYFVHNLNDDGISDFAELHVVTVERSTRRGGGAHVTTFEQSKILAHGSLASVRAVRSLLGVEAPEHVARRIRIVLR